MPITVSSELDVLVDETYKDSLSALIRPIEGITVSNVASVAPIPLPAGLPLLLTGLLGLAWVRKGN